MKEVTKRHWDKFKKQSLHLLIVDPYVDVEEWEEVLGVKVYPFTPHTEDFIVKGLEPTAFISWKLPDLKHPDHWYVSHSPSGNSHPENRIQAQSHYYIDQMVRILFPTDNPEDFASESSPMSVTKGHWQKSVDIFRGACEARLRWPYWLAMFHDKEEDSE